MKKLFLFLCCIIAIVFYNSCKDNDIEGADTLDMSKPETTIDGMILVDEFFLGGFRQIFDDPGWGPHLFTTVGKVSGIGKINKIPQKKWVYGGIKAIKGHGYIAYGNNGYLRFYVKKINSSSVIVEYQYHFENTPAPEIEIGSLSIYPNPFKGEVKITSPVKFVKRVIIKNAEEKIVRDIIMGVVSDVTIALNDLVNGVYIFEIESITDEKFISYMLKK